MEEIKKRCFIAINLPAEVKENLAKLIANLKRKNSSWQIKYVKSRGIHLTLHFLSYLDEVQIKKVKEILNEVAVKYNFFNLNISQFGGFPNLNHPRVLFVFGAGETAVAQALQKEIGEELKKASFEVEKRPWQVHLTLARIKAPVQLNLKNIKIPELNFKVESVELMESRLMPSGPEYKVIESFKLR